MEQLSNKVTGDDLTADEWDQLAEEVENIILETGLTLTSSDKSQAIKSIIDLIVNNDSYTGGGTANTYTATSVSNPKTALTDKMVVRIRIPNTEKNTGPATLNVDGLGPKSISTYYGSNDTALPADYISDFHLTTFIYDAAFDQFALAGIDAPLGRSQFLKGVTPANVIRNLISALTNTETVIGEDSNSVNVEVRGRNLKVFGGDPAETLLEAFYQGEVGLYNSNQKKLKTVSESLNEHNSSVEILHAGNFKSVGFNQIDNQVANNNLTLDHTDAGNMAIYSGAGGHTFTFTALNTKIGTFWYIVNDGTGNLTLDFNQSGGSGVLYDGTKTVANTMTMTPGGSCTVVRFGSASFKIIAPFGVS